jgi:hypothetical protein
LFLLIHGGRYTTTFLANFSERPTSDLSTRIAKGIWSEKQNELIKFTKTIVDDIIIATYDHENNPSNFESDVIDRIGKSFPQIIRTKNRETLNYLLFESLDQVLYDKLREESPPELQMAALAMMEEKSDLFVDAFNQISCQLRRMWIKELGGEAILRVVKMCFRVIGKENGIDLAWASAREATSIIQEKCEFHNFQFAKSIFKTNRNALMEEISKYNTEIDEIKDRFQRGNDSEADSTVTTEIDKVFEIIFQEIMKGKFGRELLYDTPYLTARHVVGLAIDAKVTNKEKKKQRKKKKKVDVEDIKETKDGVDWDP